MNKTNLSLSWVNLWLYQQGALNEWQKQIQWESKKRTSSTSKSWWCFQNSDGVKNRVLGISLRYSSFLIIHLKYLLYILTSFGAAHSKCWSKYAFLCFLCEKAEKRKKKHEICCKILQKMGFDQRSGANTKTLVPLFPWKTLFQ